jgi:hypothetical protein
MQRTRRKGGTGNNVPGEIFTEGSTGAKENFEVKPRTANGYPKRNVRQTAGELPVPGIGRIHSDGEHQEAKLAYAWQDLPYGGCNK